SRMSSPARAKKRHRTRRDTAERLERTRSLAFGSRDKESSSGFAALSESEAALALGGMPGDAPEPSLIAGAEILAYRDLRMPGPGSSRRGSLCPAEPVELYTQMLIAQRIEVSFDVVAVITAATRHADAVIAQSLPARHRVPRRDHYDYVYATETPVDVPSDGAFHSIPLVARSAEVTTRYVVVPRQSSDVFRLAELANPLGAPILDGPIDVYLGSDFLLTSDAGFTPPGGTIRLGLGVEQAVKTSRNTSFREEVSGLMRSSLTLKHRIEITVNNLFEHPVDIEVRERIPALYDDEEDIEIAVEQVEPAWEPYEPTLEQSPEEVELRGGHRWRLEVPGRGSRDLAVDYTVKISAKYELVGGNRREV
ncbi:MAG: DUF4139 domain-containing protein, partial [Myxococcota bacterium]